MPFRDIAFSADEGYYSVAARFWVEGQSLYSDLGFVRPPGLAWVYALPRLLGFSAGDGFIRYLSAGVAGITAAAIVWWLLRRLPVSFVAVAAACLVAWSASLTLQNEANSETWMLLPYAASALLCLVAFRRDGEGRLAWPLALAAGLLLAVAALFKQVALVGLAVPLIAWAAYGTPSKRGISLSATFFLGALAGSLIAPAFVLLSGDDLRAYFYFAWLGASSYVADAKATSGAFIASRVLSVVLPLLLPLAVIGIAIAAAGVRDRRVFKQPLFVFAGLWLGVSAIGVMASGRYYPHYFLQLLPAAAILCAFALSGLHGASNGRTWGALLIVVALLPVAFAWSSLLADYLDAPRVRSNRAQAVVLARRADYRTPEGGSVLVWGPPSSAAYIKRELWGGIPWLYHGIGAPDGRVVLGARVRSQGDRALSLIDAGPLPDTVLLSTELWPPAPGAAADDPRVPDRLEAVLDEQYQIVWRSKRGPRYGELYVRDRVR